MKIAVIPGDGIGPEVMESALSIMHETDFNPEYETFNIGHKRWKREGIPVKEEDLNKIKTCDAVLKGPIMTPPRRKNSFESVNLRIRRELDVYANIRPSKSLPVSPYKNVDLIIVRENTQGLYSGKERYNDGVAVTERMITETASKRIIEQAFELARKHNRKKVTCVHKANVMKKTCGLFKDVFYNVAANYPNIDCNEKLVDACAYELIKNPHLLDVIVTTNMFGDILSDEAAALIGSLGLMGSYNVGEKYALFEPVHGTAPDIAGKGKANPVGMIMAASYMLDYFKHEKKGKTIRRAVENVLKEGQNLTPDLGGASTTKKFTEAIITKLTFS